jgi:hypothetical protein
LVAVNARHSHLSICSILRAVLVDRGADHNFVDVGELLSAFLLELCQIPLADEDRIWNGTLLLLLP